MIRLLSVVFSLFMLINFGYAQLKKDDVNYIKKQIEELNTLAGTSSKYQFKGKKLVVDFFNKYDKRVRQDKLYLQDLDPSSIRFDQDQKRVYVSCKSENELGKRAVEGGCIERYIYQTDVVRQIDHVTFNAGTNSGAFMLKLKEAVEFVSSKAK